MKLWILPFKMVKLQVLQKYKRYRCDASNQCKGLIITPGLIDIHGHVFAGTEPDRGLSDGNSALMPDGYTFRVGVTTIVDCGGAGWKNFSVFKKM